MTNKNHSHPLFISQLGPVFFLTGIFLLNFLSRIILAPLMPTIENDLGITHGEAGIRNLSISATIFFAYLMGAGLIPAVMGTLGELHSFALAIVLVGGLIFTSVILLRHLEISNREESGKYS